MTGCHRWKTIHDRSTKNIYIEQINPQKNLGYHETLHKISLIVSYFSKCVKKKNVLHFKTCNIKIIVSLIAVVVDEELVKTCEMLTSVFLLFV